MGTSTSVMIYAVVSIGSSPRVWGQVNSEGAPVSSDRIIPTRMGTSYLVLAYRRLPRDHPHAYGDKTKHRTTP